ncbi:hypothetical protein ACP70R_032484 [Stipagrostis hirtigluma subsp. patula]
MERSRAASSEGGSEVENNYTVSILHGLQVEGSYEDPHGGTLTPVTVKLLNDSFSRTTRDGRPIVHGVALTNVRLVGMIVSFVEEENTVRVSLEDGTGISEWIFWKTSSIPGIDSKQRFPCYVEIIGAPRIKNEEVLLTAYNIRKISDFNSVTTHFLDVILVALERHEKNDPQLRHLFFSDNGMDIDKDDLLVKEVYSCIQELAVRDIRYGVSCCSIEENVDASVESISEALERLLEEGHIYTTVDAFMTCHTRSDSNPPMREGVLSEQEDTEHEVISSNAIFHNGDTDYDKTDFASYMDQIDWNAELPNLPSQPVSFSPETLFNGFDDYDVNSTMLAPTPEYQFDEFVDEAAATAKEAEEQLNDENICTEMSEYLQYSKDPEIILPPTSYDSGVCGFHYAPDNPPRLDQLTDRLSQSSNDEEVRTPEVQDGSGVNASACIRESGAALHDLDPVDPEYFVPARNTRPRLQ